MKWSQVCQELGTKGSWHKKQLSLSQEGKNLVFLIVHKTGLERVERVGGIIAIRHRQRGLAPLCIQPDRYVTVRIRLVTIY